MLQFNFKLFPTLSLFYALLTLLTRTHAAPVPLPLPSPYYADLSAYPTTPNEVLPIQPVLIYPPSPELLYQARTLDSGERDIVFVKLLQHRKGGYRPKQQRLEEQLPRNKELGIKDIFYVKALANGQFSSERLKVFRLPEFFAISVFHNANDNEDTVQSEK